MARTLRLIAETQADAFYRGEIAERIVDFAARTGGFLAADDLARHTSDWVEPITTSYRGYDVWEMPPSTQGLAVLLALNILEGYELSQISPRLRGKLPSATRGDEAGLRRRTPLRRRSDAGARTRR